MTNYLNGEFSESWCTSKSTIRRICTKQKDYLLKWFQRVIAVSMLHENLDVEA